MYLVIVDTAQIQSYIFSSNRLRENIGASHLVTLATGQWAMETVELVTPNSNNIKDARKNLNKSALDLNLSIENSENLLAEVIYTGGGNFLVIFQKQSDVKTFIRVLSRKVMKEAPNLKILIQESPEFSWQDSLKEIFDKTFNQLAEQKQNYSRSVPLLGLSVTLECGSTAFPSVTITKPIGDSDGYPASASIFAKRFYADSYSGKPSLANQRLAEIIPPPEKFTYPSDFDDLGRSFGDQSYLAIVHIDGDGIGKRIQTLGEVHKKENREFINIMRNFSDKLIEAGQQSLKSALDLLCQQISEQKIVHLITTKDRKDYKITEIFLKKSERDEDFGKIYLPFRPIVFGGGEDITFVCDGRLGISLAIKYLTQFEILTKELPTVDSSVLHATACAGISIVKTHYPFARAYALAEELCKEAKNLRRKIIQDEPSWNGSCLDWHFAVSGLSGNIETIRKREYSVNDGSLTLRPITLKDNPSDVSKTWIVVKNSLTAFQSDQWVGQRNKVKALRETLRGGKNSIRQFLHYYGLELPEIVPNLPDFQQTGWYGKSCGYFDAIELVDLYTPLKEGEEVNAIVDTLKIQK